MSTSQPSSGFGSKLKEAASSAKAQTFFKQTGENFQNMFKDNKDKDAKLKEKEGVDKGCGGCSSNDAECRDKGNLKAGGTVGNQPAI